MLTLESPLAALTLDEESGGLAVSSLRSFGRELSVAGHEFAVRARGARYAIPGWYLRALDQEAGPPTAVGLTVETCAAEGWTPVATPVASEPLGDVVAVGRVQVPAGLLHAPLDLVLGGWETYSWSSMSVYVGGELLGTRDHQPGTWSEPLRVRLPDRGAGRVELDVVLVLTGAWEVSARLAELDPSGSLAPSPRIVWPAQFEQYVEVVPAVESYRVALEELRPVEGPDGLGATARLTVAGRVVELRYDWAWSGRAIMRSGMVGHGADVPLALVDHGTWTSPATSTHGGVGDFVGLADFAVRGLLHPSGWAVGSGQTSSLWQFTARGELDTLQSSVVLFSEEGQHADDVVREYLDEHARRRVTDPTVPPFFGVDGFGSWSYEPEPGRPYWQLLDDQPDESEVLGDVRKVSHWVEEGAAIDYYSIDFATGYSGEVGEADPERLPRGFAPVIDAVRSMGTQPGIWIDTAFAGWSVGDNPRFGPSFSHAAPFDGVRPTLCLGHELYRSSFTAGLDSLVAQGIRAIKLDNFQAHCSVDTHGHLPGVHALEAISSAVTGMLGRLAIEHPEVLMHLYWGYRSPWWLLWATTIFDPGFHTEAAHPFVHPSRSLRASTVHGVNVATVARRDIPRYTKDSLGVWLSKWRWNSGQGLGDWRLAVAFDAARGNRFLQIWTGEEALAPQDQRWIAALQEILSSPGIYDAGGSFGSFDTSTDLPYGMWIADGDARAYVVGVHNPGWQSASLDLPAELASRLDVDNTIVIAGSGATVGPDGTLVLEPQAMCVLVAATLVDQRMPPSARLDDPARSSETILTRRLEAGSQLHAVRLPDQDLVAGDQLAITLRLSTRGARTSVDDIDTLAVVAGWPAVQQVATKTLPSSWQVLLIDGPAELRDGSLEVRGDLLGAEDLDVSLICVRHAQSTTK